MAYRFQEWYLLIEGTTPKTVFNDKITALKALTDSYALTTKEAKDIEEYKNLHMPVMGRRLTVTGLTGEPDRILMRIYGPSE